MKVSKVLEAIQAELKNPLPEPRVVSLKKERKMAKKKGKQVEDEVDEDLDEDTDESEDEGDEDEDEEDAKPSKKSKSKSSKKGAKPAKGKDKGKKAKSKESDDGLVSIGDLADEAGINAQSARVKLREAELGKPEGGRWKWKEGSKDLKAARKALGL